jgi:hypothetical protein
MSHDQSCVVELQKITKNHENQQVRIVGAPPEIRTEGLQIRVLTITATSTRSVPKKDRFILHYIQNKSEMHSTGIKYLVGPDTAGPYASPSAYSPYIPLWVLAFLSIRMFAVIPLASNNRFGLFWAAYVRELEGNKEYGECQWNASGVDNATIHGTSFRCLTVGSLTRILPPPPQDSRRLCHSK